jgi:hypothetical protein
MDNLTAAKQLEEIAKWLRLQPNPALTSTPPLIPTETSPQARGLKDEAAFYNYLRSTNVLGPKISQKEFEGCSLLLQHCMAAALDVTNTGYILATAYHETAGTMEPIDEYGGDAYFTRLYDVKGINPKRAIEMGNVNPGDGVKYHGRGLAQVTWQINYKKIGVLLGEDLVNHPERMKEPNIAAQALVIGALNGIFTGKKLQDMQTLEEKRRVINGTDKAELVAGIARVFIKALEQGGWS